MDEVSLLLKRWRKAAGLKQDALAVMLGVSQATVSRWENGVDRPSGMMSAKVRALVGRQWCSPIGLEQSIIARTPGIRALFDLDGLRLLGTSRAFKIMWPEVVAAEGLPLADHLLDVTCDLYHDTDIKNAIKSHEIAMIAAVSDRQIARFGDRAFRHYWAAIPKKVGRRHLLEVSYEVCDANAEPGLRHILRVGEIGY